MNGNFEVDKGSYPFNGIMVGESYKLHYVPGMQALSSVPLPRELSARASLRLNTSYWSSKAGGPSFDGTSARVRQVIGEELTGLVKEGLIQGHIATQIQQRLDAEA